MMSADLLPQQNPTRKKYFKLILQITQMLLIMLVLSVIVDFWRSPNVPEQALQQSFQTIHQSQIQNFAQISENQVAIVYFWGSWCGICRYTSPTIEQLHQNGETVLGVALRSGSEQNVRDYLRQKNWQFDSINDEKGILSQAWDIRVTPTILLIKNGKIIHSTTGIASYWGLKLRVMMARLFG